MGGKHAAPKKSFTWRVIVMTWHVLLWTLALTKTDPGRGRGKMGRHAVEQAQPSNGIGGRYTRWRNEISPPPPPIRATPEYEHVARHNNPMGLSNYFASGSPHSMPVGVSRNHETLRTKAQTSVCWIGPARAEGGKSASGSVPILLEHNGPAVVASLREDMFLSTAMMRSAYGNQLNIDFDGIGVFEGAKEVRWSPLVGAEVFDRSVSTCTAWVQSSALIAADGPVSSDASHFIDLAAKLMTCIVHYAAVQCHDFRWVHTIISAGDKPELERIRDEMAFWPDQRPYDMLRGVLDQPGENEKGSIFTTLNTAMSAYSTEAALKTTDSPNFDPVKFVRGDRNGSNPYLWHTVPDAPGKGTGDTLYIIRGRKARSASVVVALLTAIAEERRDLYNADRREGNAAAHADLLLVDDEAAHMPLPALPEWLAAPGEGILLTLNLQDPSQLAKWGHMGKSMLTQMQQLVVFRGIRDNDFLSLVEGICQTVAVERVVSTVNGSGHGPALTASASPERLPGISKAQIYSGINNDPSTVLYLGADGAPPDWIHIRPYYSDPIMLRMQVATLEMLAAWLDFDDPRRLLPLPQLAADGGRALTRAGGPELLERYHAACAAMNPLNVATGELLEASESHE
ncbi:hypothetical protein [Kocuria rosea]|uniref:hypothetical protein n=1 Tax=Kocuria rosea TaxID=1275 RepID=UPI00253F7C57|nr:hypothetical protein [Kocuria rosea]WIG18377.1 hypothetical protein QOY29_05465 [Kocuria rosea]